MPQRIDTHDRASVLARAVEHLLVAHGPTALTMRAIAQASGVSTSSMVHHLESRERMLGVCAHLSTRARTAWLTSAVIGDGPLALLPRHAAELRETKIWQGWLELGRTMPTLTPMVEEARASEAAVLARSLDHGTTEVGLLELGALVDGLRARLCFPGTDLTIETARSCLAERLRTVVGSELLLGRPLVDRSAWRWPYVPGPRAVARGDGAPSSPPAPESA